MLRSGSEILPTIREVFLLFKFFYLFLNKVQFACILHKAAGAHHRIVIQRTFHSTYVIAETAREVCTAASLAQAGRVLLVWLILE